MGTGSFGMGGSGALGRAGSGASGASTFSGAGGVAANFFAPTPVTAAGPSSVDAQALLRDTFAQRNVAAFVQQVASSPQVRGCYEVLFALSVLLTQQQSWNAIERDFAVPGGPGCMAELADRIPDQHAVGGLEVPREIARSAVLDVLLTAMGGDDDVFLGGDAAVVLKTAKANRKVFESLSAHFLTSVLYRLATRELPSMDTRQAEAMRAAVSVRANTIIASFERTWQYGEQGEKQLSHKQLLETIGQKGDWFENKLRETLKP